MSQRAGEAVFESPDIIDDSDHGLVDKKEEAFIDKDVVTESLAPILAFETFGGKVFDPKATTQTAVYSSGIPENFESPLQKFQRLKQELTLFYQELEDLSQQAPADQDAIPGVTKEIRNELQSMWSRLESAKQQSGSLFSETLEPGNSLSTDSLINELRRFQTLEAQQGAANEQETRAVYSLYRGQKMNVANQNLAEIQERVDKIEMILGNQPEAGFSFSDMSSAIADLSENLNLLEASKLDGILMRVKEVNQHLQGMEKPESEKVSNMLANQAKDNRVNEMFNLIKKWDVAAENLPTMVNRLKELKTVHDESAGIVDKVTRLGGQQKKIAELLEQDKQLLGQARDSLAKNAKIMQENINSLDQRMKALLERLG